MRDLAHTPCVIYERDELTVDNWVYLEDGQEKVVKAQSAFRTSDGQLVLDACLAGYGVALLNTYTVADAVRSGALQIVLPEVRLKDYQAIYLVYASRKHQSPALSEFLAHIQLWIQQHPVPRLPDKQRQQQ